MVRPPIQVFRVRPFGRWRQLLLRAERAALLAGQARGHTVDWRNNLALAQVVMLASEYTVLETEINRLEQSIATAPRAELDASERRLVELVKDMERDVLLAQHEQHAWYTAERERRAVAQGGAAQELTARIANADLDLDPTTLRSLEDAQIARATILQRPPTPE